MNSKNPTPSIPNPEAILVNKLTVGDAVHLIRTEGGPFSRARLLFRGLTVLVVSAFVARAIVVGEATVWHLFLPMVAEYLVLLLALPVLRFFVRDPELDVEARKAGSWIITLAAAALAWITWEAYDGATPWPEQAQMEWLRLREAIVGHEMHWPILGAALGMALSFPPRIAAYRRHGPPFMAVGLGCAMRLVVPLFGAFLLPFLASGSLPVVWFVFAVLFLAELGTLAMVFDVQRRVEKRGIEL